MTGSKIKKILVRSAMALIPVLFVSMMTQTVNAEGTKDMGDGDDGYRPYTERNKALTFGQERLSHMQVYLKSGETVYFGTSVANGTLFDEETAKGHLFSNEEMGTSFSNTELSYLNSADIWVYQGSYDELSEESLPYANGSRNNDCFLIDLPADATNTTPGYIYNGEQEDGGVDLTGTGTGYKVSSVNTLGTVGNVASGTKTNANSFTAAKDGIYSVVFFSSRLSAENPKMMKLSDKTTPFASTQKGSTIASWDISVYSNGTLQTGRVFTKALFLNMGGNALNSSKVSTGSLYSNVYAVTNDGYQYQVDFNGMDPYGFVFFANNRGLLTKEADGTTSSLYHGVRSDNNFLGDLTQHDLQLNNTPYDSSLDQTYNIFYEKPSAEVLSALSIPDPSSGKGSISDFTFKGNGDSHANEGYVGKGGTFSFNATSNISATSYQIELDFSSVNGGTVVLSNTLKKGELNSISWDGKDANGNVVPAGTYNTLKASIKLKGGEVHFPLLDVEQNVNGIKITRLNGESPDSTVYFNNSKENAGDAASPWTIDKNWTAGNQTNATAGVDSADGAMSFTNVNTKNDAKSMRLLGDGDQSALDIWAYYNRTVSLGTWSFQLVDTSFTVTKAWDRGTQSPANPTKVTMTLQQSADGNVWTKVTKDAAGSAIINPVAYDTNSSSTYTWNHLDPAKKYQVKETAMTGYSASYSTVTGDVTSGYAETVTNTYTPTTLKLTKIWDMNGTTGTSHPVSVVLSVYTDSNKNNKIGDYTLSGGANDTSWTVTIPDVDPTRTYYVYETAMDGYASIADIENAYNITGQGKVSGDGNSGFKKVITNSLNDGSFMSVEVFKYWTDEYQSGCRPNSIYLTLKKNGVLVTENALGNTIENPVELSDANDWYYIWTALVEKDASAYGYTISESLDQAGKLSVSGFTSDTDTLTFLHHFGFGGIENTSQKTSFTVNKVWQNHGGSSSPDAASVHLMQSTDGGNTYVDYEGTDVQQTLNAAGSWKYTWHNLPSYIYQSGSPVRILYKAVEDDVSDYYTSSAGAVTGDVSQGYAQTITNTSNYTELTVTKKWNYGVQAEEDRPNAVGITLYADGKVKEFCTLSADNDWTETFADLPLYDGSTLISYTVEEMKVQDYRMTSLTKTGTPFTGMSAAILNTHNDPPGDDDYVVPDTAVKSH